MRQTALRCAAEKYTGVLLMGFINEKLMLKTKTAETLYNNFAKDLPIIDYHCHLSPQMIAENYQFRKGNESVS